jgi:hypothetical protein
MMIEIAEGVVEGKCFTLVPLHASASVHVPQNHPQTLAIYVHDGVQELETF